MMNRTERDHEQNRANPCVSDLTDPHRLVHTGARLVSTRIESGVSDDLPYRHLRVENRQLGQKLNGRATTEPAQFQHLSARRLPRLKLHPSHILEQRRCVDLVGLASVRQRPGEVLRHTRVHHHHFNLRPVRRDAHLQVVHTCRFYANPRLFAQPLDQLPMSGAVVGECPSLFFASTRTPHLKRLRTHIDPCPRLNGLHLHSLSVIQTRASRPCTLTCRPCKC